MALQIQTARAVGRRHLIDGTNCQDALAVFRSETRVVGIICDGCSEGKHSEVGATLAAEYLAHLVGNAKVPNWFAFLEALHYYVEDFLKTLLLPYSYFDDWQRAAFVRDHLLFTVVGFLWEGDLVHTFYCGDGTVVLNDLVLHLNEGDMPTYPAYALVPYAIPEGTPVPTMKVGRFTKINQIAIGSDAWKDERDLLPAILDKSRLQREVNRLSLREHRFQDDVSLIVAKKVE